MQRYLIIGAMVVVLSVAGVVGYFYFFSNTPGVIVAPGGSAGLPTAGPGAPLTGGDDGTATFSSDSGGAPLPISARLVRISAGPVVPGVSTKVRPSSQSPTTEVSDSGDVEVQYIERQSGNVFSYLTRAKTLTRTSNRTVPGIQSAAWLPDASLAFVRYLSGDDFSTINTYALPATGSLSAAPDERSASQSVLAGGFFLPQNLADISVSSTSVLTLVSGVNGSSASLMRADGTRSSQIFTTPLSSLRVSFAGKNQYLAYTKPSAALPGGAFLVDDAGRFSRVAGPLNGLVALASPSGKWVLVSYTLDGAMQMTLVNTLSGESLALPVETIADKCVWASNDSSIYCGVPVSPAAANYPDDWYQGAVSFNDRIWRIEASGRYAQLVLDFNKETGATLDAVALSVDSSNTALVFVNKNDGSLWVYSL